MDFFNNFQCALTSLAPLKRAPLDSLMMTSLSVPPPPMKRPLEMLTSLGPAPIKRPFKAEALPAPKRHQKSTSATSAPAPATAGSAPAATVNIKSDPSADDSSSSKSSGSASSSADSSSGEASGSDAGKEETRAELPTDPSKMTDPSKWPAWIFCTRYSDRPSSGKYPLSSAT